MLYPGTETEWNDWRYWRLLLGWVETDITIGNHIDNVRKYLEDGRLMPPPVCQLTIWEQVVFIEVDDELEIDYPLQHLG